ncbi:peptidase m16 inactive domain-containing protein, partial [Cystoisospora suis]
MESRERQASSVLYRRLIELLYPDGSGYRYETGGIMEQIRRTSNDRVREYHRHFYKWDNLSLIFTGVFDVPLLLHTVRSSITTIENIRKNASMNSSSSSPYPPSSPSPLDDLISKAVGVPEHADRPLNFSGPRPWSDPQNFALPSSSSSAVKFDRVYFPSDDEETGRVALGWRGPPWRELETREAVDILGSYLTEGNLAVLQRELVQCENPLCANVDFSSEGFKSTCFFIEGIDVKLEKKKKEKSLTNTATEKDQKERKEDDRQGEKGEDVDGGELDGKKDNETKQKKEEKERLEGSEKQDKGEGHAMKKQKRENENVLSEEKEEEEKGENASTEVDGDEERERGSEDGGEEEEATQLEDVGKAIRSLIETEAKKPLDLSRIHMLLRRELLQFYRALETNPHDT